MKLNVLFISLLSIFWADLLVAEGSRTNKDSRSSLTSDQVYQGQDTGSENEKILPSLALIMGEEIPAVQVNKKLTIRNRPFNPTNRLMNISKLNTTEFLAYYDDFQSWFFHENLPGTMVQIKSQILPPIGSSLYALKGRGHWIYNKATIGFSANVDGTQPEEFPVSYVTPDIAKVSEKPFRVLYVGGDKLMMTDEKTVAVLERDGPRIFQLTFDLPKIGDQVPAIFAGGVGKEFDQFWFLLESHLLAFIKNRDTNQWRWIVSPFEVKVDDQTVNSSVKGLAMVIDAKDETAIKIAESSVVWYENDLYAEKIADYLFMEPSVFDTFQYDVQPMIQNKCLSCHPTYANINEFAPLLLQVDQHVRSGTMPPPGSTQLGETEKAVFLNWIGRIINDY